MTNGQVGLRVPQPASVSEPSGRHPR